MKTKLNLLFLLSAVLCLAGCRTNEERAVVQTKPEPESIQSYFNFIKQQRQGTFLLQSSSGMWGDKENATQSLTGFFSDKNRNRVNGGELTFGNHVIHPVANGYQLGRAKELDFPDQHAARDLFGKTIFIRLEVPSVESAARTTYTALTDSLYVPKEIEAIAPVRVAEDSTTFVLQEGFNLRWNVDERNLKGVVIHLEYNPQDLLNDKFKEEYPKKKHKFITVKDTPDGYTFKNADLTDFANNAVLNIRVGRANYVSLKNDDNQYDVAAFTTSCSLYTVKVK